ncbi:MAG: coenzyme F420-0:L-glutamate ligase / coenzyme F420:gamma-L-glutamate ligase [Nocardioidaceae bacterium]|nr:coenzyme F420-0:L-glutamate ligase / coenzyme F420:gamma-L-glutamate ligase [Nocardioidaceae bacterium]
MSPSGLTCVAVEGIGEVIAGDDLAALLAAAVELRDGDVLVLTSKVLSKAEGRVRTGKRDEALAGETDRAVATRGRTSIVRTHHGLVMAAAGIDASNTEADTVVLLPTDPDGSARRLRESLARSPGCNVAVLVTDTAGRAWRNGQTDIAIGAAGLQVLHDYAGRTDPYGNELSVTAPAVADELAAAADLVKGKLERRPAAVVRGLDALVLPAGEHGPGAAALVREETQDMFGLGARDAVLGALRAEDPRGFGAPCPALELVEALTALAGGSVTLVVRSDEGAGRDTEVTATLGGDDRARGRAEVVLTTAAFAMGWRADPADDRAGNPAILRLRPVTP